MMEQGNMAIAMDKDSDDEDADDDEIRPTDTLIAVAITEDESSHLEVQLMTEEGDLYVHHDIHLPDFPLCLAWLDCPPYLTSDGQQQAVGNYVGIICLG
jgi:periodic tryptophan protein 1